MKNVQFSILSYYPNFLNDENINIGIAFHNDNNIQFKMTKNWKRLQSFDDEIDLPFMKEYLIGIKNECERELFNQDKSFSLEDFTKFYVNKLRFDPIINIKVKDVANFISDTEKFYLRYDYEKQNRLSERDQIRYVKNLMKSKNIKFSTKEVSGKFKENIQFDYVLSNYGFKNFTFENKNINRQIMTAKAWSYTASNIKDYKIVFIYDAEQKNSNEFDIIMNILKENAFEILPKDRVFSFIEKIYKNEINSTELF